jgi:hypothetical protein
MRTATTSLLVAVPTAAVLLLTGSPALALPSGDGGAAVEHYAECQDAVSSGRVCTTGVITVRTTPTPSGAISESVIDNGRFELVNPTTDCTTTGSYHMADVVRAGPGVEHVVVRNSVLSNATTRCGDRTLDSRCRVHIQDSVTVVPGAIRMTSRIRVDCDAPA